MAVDPSPRLAMSLALYCLVLASVASCSREEWPPRAGSPSELRAASASVSSTDSTAAAKPAPIAGHWRLVAIDRTRLSGGDAPTLVFGDEGHCWGNTGVNEFRTTFTLEGLKHSRLEVGTAAVTRRMGPPEAMALEKLFLQRLETAVSYELSGDLLHLHSGENQNLTFERVYP